MANIKEIVIKNLDDIELRKEFYKNVPKFIAHSTYEMLNSLNDEFLMEHYYIDPKDKSFVISINCDILWDSDVPLLDPDRNAIAVWSNKIKEYERNYISKLNNRYAIRNECFYVNTLDSFGKREELDNEIGSILTKLIDLDDSCKLTVNMFNRESSPNGFEITIKLFGDYSEILENIDEYNFKENIHKEC